LFDVGSLLPEAKRQACEKSWAGPFREKVWPHLLAWEGDFAELYHPENGRPNKSVAQLLGTLLLQEANDWTDEEVVGACEFDLRWAYAMELESDQTHLCQKTLHNFRTALVEQGKSHDVFRALTDELVRVLKIDTTRQRLDSTHILSDIAKLSRLGVFCETIRVFLAALKKQAPKLYTELPAGLLRRHAEETRYRDARKEDRLRRLAVVARDTYRLVERFKGDVMMAAMEEYGLLKRLLAERCETLSEPPTPNSDDDDAGEPPVPVKAKEPKEVASDSLQTPHDPDVTYSGHKGQGYEVQISETCVAGNAVQLITEVKVTPSAHHDARATLPVIEALKTAGHTPQELVADTAYGGADNADKAAGHGVNLLAPCPGKGKPDPQVAYPAPAVQCPTTSQEAGVWLKAQEAQAGFGERYAIRAGIEGTNSELKRGQGLGRLRVRGGDRVSLVVHFKVAACNMKRALAYWRRPPIPDLA
jgi:hypothetical protein